MKGQKELGTPAATNYTKWVQTERAAHERWAALIRSKPRAAQLMHILVAHMASQNAVVVSQKTLAKMMGVTDRTVRTAVKELEERQWVQVVKLNGPGTVSAYVVNDRVAWGQKRSQLGLSTFSAEVIADQADQDQATLTGEELRKIPQLYAGEQQVPHGDHDEPPSQGLIEGMEPDLPARDPAPGE